MIKIKELYRQAKTSPVVLGTVALGGLFVVSVFGVLLWSSITNRSSQPTSISSQTPTNTNQPQSFSSLAVSQTPLTPTQPPHPSSPAPTQAITQNTPEFSGHTPFIYGALQAGQTATHPISLEGGLTLFGIQWDTGTVAVTLVDPNGQVIDPTYAENHPDSVTYNADQTVATYYLPNAVSGLWQLTLQGVTIPGKGSNYMAYASFDSNTVLTGKTDSDQYAPGATAIINATLSGSPASATITATIFDANGTSQTVSLYHMSENAYQATFLVPDVTGYAEIRLAATGTTASGTPFTRGTSLIFQISP